MPILFLLVGVMLIVVALNDKLSNLGSLVKDDFQPSSSGGPSFTTWVVALFIIGSLGYVKTLKPVANSFLVLIVIVMFLRNGGLFDKFYAAIKQE